MSAVSSSGEKSFKGAYAGSILDINLSKNEILRKPLDPEFAKMHLGGKGFVARILYDALDASTEPISPDNIFMIAGGPMTGIAPASGRVTVGFRSPLTRTHGYSSVGGEFGLEMKSAGYDIIIIRGRAAAPVYIQIADAAVSVKDAAFIWGCDTHVTINKIRHDFKRDAQICCIGPAGENVVYYSGVCFNPDRYAAEGGGGAVMGSKNLKAIAIVGTGGIRIADRQKWQHHYKAILKIYAADPTTEIGRKIGSNFLADHHNEKMALTVKNLQFGRTDIAECDGRALNNRYVLKNRSGCSLCPIACQRSSQITDGPDAGLHNNGPEYSSVSSLGWRVGIKDLKSIIKNAELGDRLGLDLLKTPGVIAFAMECYQRGIISAEDVDGLDLTWGNTEAVSRLLEKIAYRDGIGDVFANGILAAVQHFGPESEPYAMHIKGNDLPPNEPRSNKTYNMRYAIAPRGADHLQASGVSKTSGAFAGNLDDQPPREAMKRFKSLELRCMIVNLLNVCNWAYSAYSSSFEILEQKHEHLLALLNAAAGWNLKMSDLIQAAERNIILERAINAKYGFRRKDDYFPQRMLKEACPSEIDERVSSPFTDFDERLDWYYAYTGIDKETGMPLRSKLEAVGLGYVADDMDQLRGGK